eukprot:3104326-Pleurochrysis_carterae.AAC.1
MQATLATTTSRSFSRAPAGQTSTHRRARCSGRKAAARRAVQEGGITQDVAQVAGIAHQVVQRSGTEQ